MTQLALWGDGSFRVTLIRSCNDQVNFAEVFFVIFVRQRFISASQVRTYIGNGIDQEDGSRQEEEEIKE